MPTTATFQGYPGLIGYFKRVAGWQESADFKAMLDRAGGVIAEDYLTRVVVGTTATGGAVRDSAGIRRRRKGKYRGADGAPQTPFGRRSRAHKNYRWAWTRSGNKHTFTDRIDGPAWIGKRVRYYGYAGISPKGRAALDGVLRSSVLKLLKSGPS